MKKLILFVIVVLGVLQFGGCNVVTAFNSYEFNEHNPSCKQQAGYYLRPDIKSEKENWILFPGLIDLDLYDGPYTYYFSIGGDFDKLVSVESKFTINNERTISVPLSVARMNAQRNVAWTGSVSFPDGQHTLPIEWGMVETLRLETTFVGEKGGVQESYSVVNDYKKKHELRFGNRFLLYIAYF